MCCYAGVGCVGVVYVCICVCVKRWYVVIVYALWYALVCGVCVYVLACGSVQYSCCVCVGFVYLSICGICVCFVVCIGLWYLRMLRGMHWLVVFTYALWYVVVCCVCV